MAHGRQAPKLGNDGCRHRPKVALPIVELAKRIADMNTLNGIGGNTRITESALNNLFNHVGQI